MITTALINIGYYIVQIIMLPFPDSSGLPQEFTDAISFIGGYLYILDPIVPIATLATVVGLVFAVDAIFFLFKFFRWVFQFIPVVGAKT
jgi:hypothetical protein